MHNLDLGPEELSMERLTLTTRRDFIRFSTLSAGFLIACVILPKRVSAKEEVAPQEPSLVIVDIKKCVGCRICEMECARKNYKLFNPRHANLQVVHINPPVSVPNHCYLCKDAPCIAECPVTIDAETGTRALYHDPKIHGLKLDNKACTGCWKCIDVCQRERSGILRKNLASKRPEGFCTLCDGDPSCVKFCPNDAMSRVPITFDGKHLSKNPYAVGKELANTWYR